MNREADGSAIWWGGLACATGAVALGLAYLVAAGAPVRMIGMNAAAFLVGLAAYVTVAGPKWRLGNARALIIPALGSLLLATALLAPPVEGAARWVTFGPLTLQVSLLVLPAMLILFARAPDAGGVAGIAIAALALALQPDRAMAGALVAGLALLAVRRRGSDDVLALAAAGAGFAGALLQPDLLPAVPYVDEVFHSSFDVHPLAGAAVLAGAGLLLAPALMVWHAARDRNAALAFGALWLAVIFAAAIGNYPTPVVGYGGSAIVGYLLSLAVLRPVRARQSAISTETRSGEDAHDGPSLAVRVA